MKNMPEGVNNETKKQKKTHPLQCCCVRTNKKQKLQSSKIIKTESAPMTILKEPFYKELPNNLGPGTCIQIEGRILPECSRFAINFVCGKDPNSDIAFHINPRLSQRYIVRNSRFSGQWGKEETTSITKFNLQRDKVFQLHVLLTEADFLVSINGKHVCGYVFRVPVENVKGLQVDGPLEVLGVEFGKVEIYPAPHPQNEAFPVPQGLGQQEKLPIHQQLEVPLTAKLSKGFQRGWQLEINGRIKILPYTFFINLQEGSQLWPHPNIPLHLNPRFSGAHGNHIFVRNSWSNGHWDQEERTTGFQFIPGSKFHVAIRRHDEHFAVWVDGKLAGEFRFRMSPDSIDTLYIQGDVTIHSVYMKEQIDDYYFSKSQDNINKYISL